MKLIGWSLVVASIVMIRSGVSSQENNFTGYWSYQTAKSLRDSLLSPDYHSKALRPVQYQGETINITGFFSLVGVVSLDDVKQELVTNGFFIFSWRDQTKTWNMDDYDGMYKMEMQSSDVWRPRLQIVNALQERDPFQDSESYTLLTSFGETVWQPGGLFTTYCELNLRHFPFDVQTCKQQLCPINHDFDSVQFQLIGEIQKGLYIPNSGWSLLSSKLVNERRELFTGFGFSCPTIHFELKRRPTTIILNVILPVVLLSLLNNFVFLIPLESGENIGYAITVLLSMTVFLSTVSSLTPQVTNVIPSLTIYLFVLLLMSVLTVGTVIFTEHLHHRDETKKKAAEKAAEKEEGRGGNFNNRSYIPRLRLNPLSNNTPTTAPEHNNSSGDNNDENVDEEAEAKTYQRIARRINLIFFVIVMVIWSVATLWYFISTNI